MGGEPFSSPVLLIVLVCSLRLYLLRVDKGTQLPLASFPSSGFHVENAQFLPAYVLLRRSPQSQEVSTTTSPWQPDQVWGDGAVPSSQQMSILLSAREQSKSRHPSLLSPINSNVIWVSCAQNAASLLKQQICFLWDKACTSLCRFTDNWRQA